MIDQSANTHLSREDIIKNGSIFTGSELVNLVFEQLSNHLQISDFVVGDFGAGYGAFIERFKNNSKRCFGTELDSDSYNLLQNLYPDIDLYKENSLINVTRDKYNLSNKDWLIVVGNPPYNDTTSIFKKGEKGELRCDDDLVSRDLGISFLKAYNKLEAEYVCVLHPLAYLTKKQNFNSLKAFKDNYKLLDATIFSSKEFKTIRKASSEFPVVAALYKRCDRGMTYDDIREFEFSIYKSDNKFVLKNIPTIDGHINKYPKKGQTEGLQFYTLRDMNALMRNASFVENKTTNGVPVDLDNLYQYSWLYFLKSNYYQSDRSYILGNLSPLYTEKIENKDFSRSIVSFAYNNCELVKKYFSVEEIENKYGQITDDYSSPTEELLRMTAWR